MTVPLIIVGDPNSILRNGPARMRDQATWTQMDSDIIAHFIQVHAQITKSRWAHAKVSFTTQGEKPTNAEFPDFEDFVYAAVYFRQLVLKKDMLLKDAVDRYLRHLDDGVRAAWIGLERDAFDSKFGGNCFPMLSSYTVRELFDAFLYGAGLVHKLPRLEDSNRDRFLHLYDNEMREKVLFTLHTSLRQLLNHVGNVALVMYQDFGHWIQEYGLPRPDVRWHDRLFAVPLQKPDDA